MKNKHDVVTNVQVVLHCKYRKINKKKTASAENHWFSKKIVPRNEKLFLEKEALREKCPYSELFWSVFSHIRTEYREILRISPYSVRMRENTDTFYAVKSVRIFAENFCRCLL